MSQNSFIQDKVKDLIEVRANQSAEDQIVDSHKILSEMGSIDTRTAFSKVNDRIKTERPTSRLLHFSMRVAAILFIPLLISASWLLYRQIVHNVPGNYASQKITSPAGMRSQITLPDGSKVWLNAESSIEFSIPFPKNSRDVNLQGEAFFDVSKNPDKPFVVHSGCVNVKVLGTRFNCKAFDEDRSIEVVLEEGKITLNQEINAAKKETILSPGDRAVIEKTTGKLNIRNGSVEKYIAWHEGKLVFDNTSIADVAVMLERWYGVDVEIADKGILNYRFTTTFENESLLNVLEMIGLSSPINLNYIPATIGLDKKIKTKAKVIISNK